MEEIWIRDSGSVLRVCLILKKNQRYLQKNVISVFFLFFL